MTMRATILIGGLLLAVAGCDSPTAPTETKGFASMRSGQQLGLRISGLTVNASADMATVSWQTNLAADGAITVSGPADSDNPSWTITLNGAPSLTHSATITGLVPGSGYMLFVRSTAGTQSVTSSPTQFSTPIPEGLPTSQLVATSFTVIEVPYGSNWYYAPLVTVRETTGAGTATVTNMTFQIPGLGPSPSFRTSKCIKAGEERTLLNEIYGDFELTIDHPGIRASASTATGTLMYVDGSGRRAELSLSGPIVAGTYPSTYSGGTGTWTCGPSAGR